MYHEGSHRQFKHPSKPGRVTIAGHPSTDVPPDLGKHHAPGGIEGAASMKYLVVVEHTATSAGAFVPDLAGCVAVGNTEEVERLIEEAIALHVAGMREDNIPVPEPRASSKFVEVA